MHSMSEQEQWPTSAPTAGQQLPNKNYFIPVLENALLKSVTVDFKDIVGNCTAVGTSTTPSSVAATPKPNETKLQQVMDEFGFAIISDVLSSRLEIETVESLFCRDLISIVAPKPEHTDPRILAHIAADPISRWPSSAQLGAGFCSDFGLPQGRAAWFCRTHSRVQKVWSELHGVDSADLCCGTDNVFFDNNGSGAASIRPPWELAKQQQQQQLEAKLDDGDNVNAVASLQVPQHDIPNTTSQQRNDSDQHDYLFQESAAVYGVPRLWPHSDINRQLAGGLFADSGSWYSVQGVLYLRQDEWAESSTVVWPRSHREVYEKMMSEKNFAMFLHYVPLPREYQPSFLRNARRIPVKPGSLLIWDSRTVHQGTGGRVGSRLAVPVCFDKKDRRSVAARDRKLDIVRRGGVTTHWPALGQKHDMGFRDRTTTVSLREFENLRPGGDAEKKDGDNDGDDDDDDDDGSADDALRSHFNGKLTLRHNAHRWMFQGSENGKLPPEIEAML